MTSAIDPYRRFQRQTALQAGACWCLTLCAVVWAWRLPVPGDAVIVTVPSAQAAVATATTATIDPATWNILLWRPFTDTAQPTTPATSLALKLLSILRQGDGLTAAIAPGDNTGILYVKAGDTCNGFSVVRVEADGVVLRVNGQDQRLGLEP